MDVLRMRLIEEVRKRPNLWAKPKQNANQLWAEVGKSMNLDAFSCKRTWRILRIRYWVELKRIALRIEKAKENGRYHPDNTYTKWHFFDNLRFLDTANEVHRNYPESNNSNAEIVPNISIENDNEAEIVHIHHSLDSEQDIKSIDSNLLETEFVSISNENTPHHCSDTFVKEEPELRIEADTHLTEHSILQDSNSSVFSTPQLSNNFGAESSVQYSIKYEHPDQATTPPGEPSSRSTNFSDENYCFLYSFLSQTKRMSQTQKMEFRAKMKSLLLYIFPSSSSVEILKSQLNGNSDDDPDKSFLISFWPYMQSMSLAQNLHFRSKMVDLIILYSLTPKIID